MNERFARGSPEQREAMTLNEITGEVVDAQALTYLCLLDLCVSAPLRLCVRSLAFGSSASGQAGRIVPGRSGGNARDV
jgi:hypothetical protein